MHLRCIDLQIISMKSDLISHGSGIPDAENIQASKRRSGALDGIFCLLPRQKEEGTSVCDAAISRAYEADEGFLSVMEGLMNYITSKAS